MTTTQRYDVQELIDIIDEQDKASGQDNEKYLKELWESIRVAIKFKATSTILGIGVERDGQQNEASRNLFEYLRCELTKIGQFNCEYKRAGTQYYIEVRWDRYNLRLPSTQQTGDVV